jgi:mannosyltransferase OCH1-like enzyme
VIPHRIHQIWVGDKQMPQECVAWVKGWKELHPGWEHTLWTDREVNSLLPDLVAIGDYISAAHPAMRADILRYELLRLFGGIYLDVDVEPQLPLDDLAEDMEAFVVLEDYSGPWFGNAVLGATMGHPFFKQLCEALPESVTQNWHRPINERTGPVFLSKQWKKGDTFVLGPKTFYPYMHDEKWRRGEPFPNAYGIHHWLGSWQ